MKTMWPTENATSSRPLRHTGEQLRIHHHRALTGRFGLSEHARQDVPPVSSGYTTDDNARALAVLGEAGLGETGEAARYLRFVPWARVRRVAQPDVPERRNDAHGRALWGLGTSIAVGVTDRWVESVFLAGLDLDTSHPRRPVVGGRLTLRAGWLARVPYPSLGRMARPATDGPRSQVCRGRAIGYLAACVSPPGPPARSARWWPPASTPAMSCAPRWVP